MDRALQAQGPSDERPTISLVVVGHVDAGTVRPRLFGLQSFRIDKGGVCFVKRGSRVARGMAQRVSGGFDSWASHVYRLLGL